MTPYSQDLRQRVFDTIRHGDGLLRQIARRFLVSVSFVVRLLQLHCATGSVELWSHGGAHPARLGPDDLERLRELIRQQPDATLEECCHRLGLSCSTMTISRALKRLGLPRKKKVPRAQEQGRPDVQQRRPEFRERMAGIDPKSLVFVDECGVNTAMTRRYSRAPVEQRVYTDNPGRWESITLVAGIRLSGVTANLAFPGPVNSDVFETYVKDVLAPELKPGDVVIWDNLKPHETEEGIEAVEGAGAEVVPLPTWGPDMTPMEELVSKVKRLIRLAAAARTKETVYSALGSALHDMTLGDIAGWVQKEPSMLM